jgi:hypothetical protein
MVISRIFLIKLMFFISKAGPAEFLRTAAAGLPGRRSAPILSHDGVIYYDECQGLVTVTQFGQCRVKLPGGPLQWHAVTVSHAAAGRGPRPGARAESRDGHVTVSDSESRLH